ncbi:uncharacterized protein UTRI_03484 [Ustilago trichophora]|uniref:Reverse transcriptase domain-containing protein n=1 Tax=Ustilago trichophora TaxID=86804 RepID=A0A5C3E3U8_9BASI|nr:uncharacterized protein UTRI_03484 [Ustilago trichophora]
MDMEQSQRCYRCAQSWPPNHFIGANGRPVRSCARCRKKPPAPSPPSAPGSPPRSVAASPRSTAAPLEQAPSPPVSSPPPSRRQTPPRFENDSSAFASVASVSAVQRSVSAVEHRLGNLERQLDSRFSELLNTLRAPHPAPLASTIQQASLPQQQALPLRQPAAAPAFPSAGSLPILGESPPLSITRCFAWVPPDVVSLVERDQLKPEHLAKLRDPESRVSKEPVRASTFVVESGQLTLAVDSTDSRTDTFIKAIPSLAALTQVWLVYIAIRVRVTGNLSLNEALLTHLKLLVDFDHLYTWRAVADYHLAVCRIRFGTGAVHTWGQEDFGAVQRVLAPFRKTTTGHSNQNTSSGLNKQSSSSSSNKKRNHQGAAGSSSSVWDPCRRFNANLPCSGCNRPHACIHCRGLHPRPAASSPKLASSRPKLASPPPKLAPRPSLVTTLPASPLTSPPVASAPVAVPPPPPQAGSFSPQAGLSSPQAGFLLAQAGSRPPLDSLAPAGIVDMPSDRASNLLLGLLTGLPPSPRPNTLCELPIFDVTDVPATVGTLQLRHWSRFLDLYPDRAFAAQLRGALQHSVKLGYNGPLCSSARLDAANLPMDPDDIHHLRREIEARLAEGRLRRVDDPAAIQLVCSPVGVVPKPHSDKKRTIYHLSHPRRPGSRLPSINDGINTSFVAIHYESLDAIMEFVRDHPSASLWKADLEDAFRHVIVAESDARLMGIHFDGQYFQECALAFGGRSSPFLFNLFAEFLHWLASFALQSVTTSPTLHSDVSHYLDDFFGASDAAAPHAVPIQVLSLAAAALGFKISSKKTVWDTTRLEILGIKLDSVAQTASITQERRQRIITMCLRIIDRGRATLLELQQVAGHLQFVTRVAPHGRAFLRRLYDAVRAHYRAPFGRRISQATRAELVWWIETLHSWDGVSLLQPSPLVVEHVWTDASPRAIGAHLGSMEQPSAAFSKELSRRHRRKNIRFLEALAVLEALRRFSPLWTGPRKVIVHVDNENVEYGLRKGSIRDPATQTLFREIFSLCLCQHIDLVPVPLPDNLCPPVIQRGQTTQQPPPAFAAVVGLSSPAAFLLWNGLAGNTRSRSSAVCNDYLASCARGLALPFPATATTLVEWCAHHHGRNRSYGLLKRNLATLKSWHIDLGLDTSAFDSERLARVARGYKRVVGVPAPAAKLPITLPLLRQLVQALHVVCPLQHDRRMYRAAFCLAFACFLRAGEFTWEAQGAPSSLTVGSVSFATDRSFATVFLPSSKTDPFRTGATLTAPAVPLSTCAVAALATICHGRHPSAPLFTLDGGLPFSRQAFSSMLRRCLAHCGIEASAYSGHSFRRGAATWAASNGVDDDTIRALGRWRSDCFRRYIDKPATERAATARSALYANTSHHLDLSVAAWRDL